MAVPAPFRVISQVPVVVEDAGQPISYQPGQIFYADPQNASVMRLLEAAKIIPVVGTVPSEEGTTVIAGPPGLTGPPGPPGPSGGGTLDAAYDFGGAGAGRTITVDAGAVRLNKTSVDANNGLEVAVTAGTGLAALFTGASISCPDPNSPGSPDFGGERFGVGAEAIGDSATALGAYAKAPSFGSTVVGSFAEGPAEPEENVTIVGAFSSADGEFACVFGEASFATSHSIVVGELADCDGVRSILIGTESDLGTGDTTLIGHNSTTFTTGAGAYLTVIGNHITVQDTGGATDRSIFIGHHSIAHATFTDVQDSIFIGTDIIGKAISPNFYGPGGSAVVIGTAIELDQSSQSVVIGANNISRSKRETVVGYSNVVGSTDAGTSAVNNMAIGPGNSVATGASATAAYNGNMAFGVENVVGVGSDGGNQYNLAVGVHLNVGATVNTVAFHYERNIGIGFDSTIGNDAFAVTYNIGIGDSLAVGGANDCIGIGHTLTVGSSNLHHDLIAIGSASDVDGAWSLAVGTSTSVSGEDGVGIGHGTVLRSYYGGVAIGGFSTAGFVRTGTYLTNQLHTLNIAIGASALAGGVDTIAIGDGLIAGASSQTDRNVYFDIVAIGDGCQAGDVNNGATQIAATGDGVQTSFSGTLSGTPIWRVCVEWTYVIGGITYVAQTGPTTSASTGTFGPHLTTPSNLNGNTGNFTLTFTTPPDNATNIVARPNFGSRDLVVIGNGCVGQGSDCVAIGDGSQAGSDRTHTNCVAIGNGCLVQFSNAVALGQASRPSASNQFVVGSYVPGAAITDVWFGAGPRHTDGQQGVTAHCTIHGTDGQEFGVSNGSDINIAGGRGYEAGDTGGRVKLQIALNATPTVLTDAVIVDNALGYVAIGSASPTSHLHVQGSAAFFGVAVTANTTAGDERYAALDATAGNVTYTLPPIASCPNRSYKVVRKDNVLGNTAQVAADGAELINGVSTFPFAAQYDSAEFWNDGAEWYTW